MEYHYALIHSSEHVSIYNGQGRLSKEIPLGLQKPLADLKQLLASLDQAHETMFAKSAI